MEMIATRTVLIVDDDPDDIELTTLAIQKSSRNIHIISAGDGKSAMVMLVHGTLPDLIFLDLKMPGMSGVEVLRQIRSSERLRRIPVVVITSSSLDTDMREALNAGADAFAHKAFDMVRFNREIHMLLTEWLHV